MALVGNLIAEATAEKQCDNNDTEDMPKVKKRKTDSISNMQLLIEKKEENRAKRHSELIELQRKSIQLQQDAVEAYKSTMNQFLTIYKKNSSQ